MQGASTHPDDATLVGPLSAAGKEGIKNQNTKPLFTRSVPRGDRPQPSKKSGRVKWTTCLALCTPPLRTAHKRYRGQRRGPQYPELAEIATA